MAKGFAGYPSVLSAKAITSLQLAALITLSQIQVVVCLNHTIPHLLSDASSVQAILNLNIPFITTATVNYR